MEAYNPMSTPSDPNQNLHDFGDSKKSKYPYRELVGSLMYLVVATRPDISYAVGNISRYVAKPTVVL